MSMSAEGIDMLTANTKDEVTSLLKANQSRLTQLGVKRLGLFGSFVRQAQRTDSDIDLLVEFEPDCETYGNLLDLYDFLEGLFHREVEIVTPKSLSPYIGPHILNEVEYVAFNN
jgi:uncharacterized protein